MISMHKTSFKINKNSEPFIIAEAGINHNGEIQKALEMINVAKNAGVNAIKFQAFKASGIVADSSLTYSYKSQGKQITESQFDLFHRCELDKDNFLKIKKACDDAGILFLATPETRSDLDMLLEIGINVIKVGSDGFTNIPLLKDFSTTNLPLIISCGMSNLEEVEETLNEISSVSSHEIILMLTTSEYPTISKNVNLLKLETLSKKFPNVILGYSDHTEGVLASSIAVGFGAKVFEKHFTLDKNFSGPDHWFSADPKELKEWADSIKTAYNMLGLKEIKPTKIEEEMRILARKSVIAIEDISKNENFTEKNIGARRPGNGLPAKKIVNFLGKRSTRNITKGDLIKENDITKNDLIKENDSEVRILITGAGGAGSLGRELMKSFRLSSRNYKIIATNSSSMSLGLYDDCKGYVIPSASSENYIQKLLDICRKERIQVVVGGSEPEIETIAQNMNIFLKNGIKVLTNTIDIIKICNDKYNLSKFLSEKGIKSPKTELFTNEKDFEKFHNFPLVIKPRFGSGSRNVFVVNDIEEAIFFCNYLKKYEMEPLIQEYVGDYESEFTIGVLCTKDGKLNLSIAMKRLLDGDLSTKQILISKTSKKKYVVSSGHSQGIFNEFKDIEKMGIEIAKKINSDGPINIQCRKIKDEISVFEINPRFSGTTTARSLVGHNEPDIFCRYRLFGEIPEKTEYRKGCVMRDFNEKILSLDKL